MGSCAAPSAKGDDKFITTDYLQQCRIFDQEAISGMDCIETKTCGAGKYYEVYRGKDRLVMVINGAGFLNEKEGVTLLSITDKMIKVSRLKEDKRK